MNPCQKLLARFHYFWIGHYRCDHAGTEECEVIF